MLELRKIHKSYENQPLLRGISFRIGKNETVCLLGASGSGKSTILQLIAGLDAPEAGQVLWNGVDLATTPAHRRDFSLVFQDYALFPHLDVFGNVAFGPQMRGWSAKEVKARVHEVLDLVNLEGFEGRLVGQLSGGEQQRVALARALAPRPLLLMFDEPLAALDRALREELLDELRQVLARTRIPALYVTHDQDEAFKIGDRILLLHDGLIVSEGAPRDLWLRPGSRWVAEFLGLGSILAGRIVGRTPRVQTALGIFPLRCSHHHRSGDLVHLLARPTPAPRGARFTGTVHDVIFQQDGYRVVLSNGLFFHASQAPRKGGRVTVRLHLECLGWDEGD
jgi:ABC-type Fe3+/spermidine/putrescine transport system ATPase subunit